MKKKLILFVTCGLFFLAGCQSKENLTKKQAFTYMEDTPVVSVNPQTTIDTAGMNIINNTFEGLYGLDNDGKLEPLGAKEKPKKVKDNIYEISLNPASKWSDGTSVTAEDYLLGFQKGVEGNSPYRLLFKLFKNGEEVLKNPKNFSQLGIKAKDQQTLEIELEKEEENFEKFFILPIFFPANKNNQGLSIEETTISNGPFILDQPKESNPFSWHLKKNKNYWQQEKVKTEEITGLVDINNDNRLSNYNKLESSLIPIRNLPGKDIAQDPEYLTVPYYQTGYMKYNKNSTVLKNENLRKMIYYATNRDESITWATMDFSTPSLTVLPTLKETSHKDWEEKKYDLDKDKVESIYKEDYLKLPKEEWKEDVDVSKVGQVVIKVLTSNEPEKRRLAESFQYSIERIAPGIQVDIKSLRGEDLTDAEEKGDYDILVKESLPMVESPYWEAMLLKEDVYEENSNLPTSDLDTYIEKNWIKTYKINPLYQKKNSFLISSRLKDVQVNKEGPLLSFKNSYRIN